MGNQQLFLLFTAIFVFWRCDGKEINEQTAGKKNVKYTIDQFCMGADLSVVNQVENFGGVFRDSGQVRDVYRIFSDHGANTVRLRLWHSPKWTKEVYGVGGKQLYNDLYDVEKSIQRAKSRGMAVNLDFHFSDTWADPGKQAPPDAWKNITSVEVLKDSVYNYVKNALGYLDSKGLMPEMVQMGNEINCGMMVTIPGPEFPKLSVCDGYWVQQGEIINAGIKAVREVSSKSNVKTKIILHVADPKNPEWWFDGIVNKGHVNDFEIIGFSYYHIWHTTVLFNDIPALVKKLKEKFGKQIMIVETAYPWTSKDADSYPNIFRLQPQVNQYFYTPEGQYDFMVKLTQQIMDAGGSGIMYWEPAWITSSMKDLWGSGSSWDNCTFFDFQGNTLPGIDFMNRSYEF